MRAYYFNQLSLGTFFQGQGTTVAVEQAAEAAVRALATKLASKLSRGLSLWHGLLHFEAWHALSLKRMPAATMPAMCLINSNRRDQRDTRWVPGVVVTRGTVGVVS
jgi:hypothetical protein